MVSAVVNDSWHEHVEEALFIAEPREAYNSKNELRTYRDLRAWKAAMDLAELAYRVTGEFPANEKYGLASQIKSAAVSVPSNIAEGWGRDSSGDFDRFLGIASGSLRELETQLLLTLRFGYGDSSLIMKALDACDSLGGQLYLLKKSVQKRRTTQKRS